jgi:methylenetetrahydrofolate dehydrogenase (NADP+) / methenyltetrahydrofolate cyclohydrolase
MAIILDGIRIATEIKNEVATEIGALTADGIRPGLAVILAGDNSGSEIYVRNKVKASEALGIFGEKITLPSSVTTAELIEIVHGLNARDDIDGILVQLPLPPQVDKRAVLLEVSPDKDVDGFHPLNLGRLATLRPGLVPCTPSGIMEMLRRYNIPIEGREATVVGRSEIVGRPMAMLLTNANATVSICHSKTRNPEEVCRRADILVVAAGKPGLITNSYVKPGATVIDVGINRIDTRAEFDHFFKGDAKREAAFAKNGSVLIGDVHPEVAEVAGAITPVPGGVGPLTIAMLMANTVRAARMRRGTRSAKAVK